jgi:hypothetical protein
MMTKVAKEGVRAVCDIVKNIEKTFDNFDFDSREEYEQTVTYLESCLKHAINDLKEYPPLDL